MSISDKSLVFIKDSLINHLQKLEVLLAKLLQADLSVNTEKVISAQIQ